MQPSLTTINYPGKDLGEIAARNLIDQLNNKTTLQIASRIIIRRPYHSPILFKKRSLECIDHYMIVRNRIKEG